MYYFPESNYGKSQQTKTLKFDRKLLFSKNQNLSEKLIEK